MPFIELLSVDSTNNYALTQIHAGLTQHGAAFFAHEQVAGKGQRGRSWKASKDSSLIISIVIDAKPLLLLQQFQFNACVAVTVCEFFSRYAGNNTSLKWPNDLYWCDRKAGGILIENIIGARRLDSLRQKPEPTVNPFLNETLMITQQELTNWLWAVVGIGININQVSFPEELKNPVSLKQITGRDFEPIKMAKELCVLLDMNFKKLTNGGFDEIYALYLNHLYKKGELVKFKKNNRVFEAAVKSVSPTGELVIQHAFEERYNYGEIEWIIPSAK